MYAKKIDKKMEKSLNITSWTYFSDDSRYLQFRALPGYVTKFATDGKDHVKISAFVCKHFS